RLVAGVPDDPVPRGVEDPVQRERQLDHTEVGPEVPAGPGHLGDQEVPDLAGQPVELRAGQPAQVRGFPDRLQQAHSLLLGRSNPAPSGQPPAPTAGSPLSRSAPRPSRSEPPYAAPDQPPGVWG